MTHEELEEALPLYAAGALERSERQMLEAHLLSGCTTCHVALKDYQSLASLLPFGLSPVEPPRSLKAKIMAARNPTAEAQESTQKEEATPTLEPGDWMNHLFPPVSTPRAFSWSWAWGFATVAAVTLAGYLGWTYVASQSAGSEHMAKLEAQIQDQSAKLAGLQRTLGERDQTLSDLQTSLDQKASDIDELKEKVIERETELEQARALLAQRGVKPNTPQDELASLLRKPDLRVVSLAGSDMAKTASGMILYDAATKKVWLYAVNLPECLNGTFYQLWAIDGKPKSIGKFHMDSGETAHLLVMRVSDFEQAKQFAVSLEPPGGRPQPTGPLYLVSRS
jgi:hypothetical protein